MTDWQPYLTLAVAVGTLVSSLVYNGSQRRVAHAKLQLDLFDRRMAVYDEVTKFIDFQAANHGELQDVTPFLQAVSRAKWLFDLSVVDWIEGELLTATLALANARQEARALPNGPEKAQKMLAAVHVAVQFQEQYQVRDRLFRPFLQIRHQ